MNSTQRVTFHPDVEPVADLHDFADSLSDDDENIAYCLTEKPRVRSVFG